jgi:hypothetical protein
MSILYTSVSGRQITAHSHSGGNEWSCPRRYKYKRIDGWQSREEGVALMFGKCVESAIQYHHQKGRIPETGVDEFKVLWWKQHDNEELTYTQKSGDWDDHYRMGVELLSLYEAILPTLPIQNEQFQVEVKRPLFGPGEPQEGLEFVVKLDMISEVPADHPLLPQNGSTGLRKVIIDIKTSSNSFYTDSRLSALDDQLIDYSWVTGIETVAFLVLVKNHTELGTGDWVTIIRGPKVGKKYQVIDINPQRVLVLTKSDYDDYMARKKLTKGKGAKEACDTLLTEYFYKGQSFRREDLTKQRIQFLPAVISEEDRQEAYQVARQEAAEISCASQNNFWPKKPGVRFPHNPCNSCEMLGLCINDPQLIQEKLVQISGVF